MSWKPYVHAIMRGGLRAMPLEAGEAKAAVEVAKRLEDALLEQGVPTLQSITGTESPPRQISGAGEIEQVATRAWDEVREVDKQELIETTQRMLREQGPDQLVSLERLARRLPSALLKFPHLRHVIQGRGRAGPSRAVQPGGAGSPRSGNGGLGGAMLVCGALFVAGLVGYVGTRPRIDQQPPVLHLHAEGSVRTKTVTLHGRVEDDHLELVKVGDEVVIQRDDETAPPKLQHAFKIELPLPTLGEHSFEVVATDAKGHVTRQKVTVTRLPFDVEIELTEPAHAIRGGRTRVAGKVHSVATVTNVQVNGAALELSPDGSFEGTIDLPATSGRHDLHVIASGADSEGDVHAQVLVDHDSPTIKLLEQDALAYDERHEVYLRLEDASDWVTVSVVSGARAKKATFHPGREAHYWIEVPEGKNVVVLEAKDPVGNTSRATLRVERKLPSEKLKEFKVASRRYLVTRSLTVGPDEALALPPGATIEFAPRVEIAVHGQLIAQGTPSLPIVLKGQAWAGVSLKGAKSKAILKHCTFTGAKREQGGAISIRGGGELVAERCAFDQNLSNAYGGAIYLQGAADHPARARIRDTSFARNHTAGDGGAIFCSVHVKLELKAATFDRNVALGYGGALVGVAKRGADTELLVEGSTFQLNRAKHGGGLLVGRSCKARVIKSVFESNSSSVAGGGVLTMGVGGAPARLELEDCQLQHNSAGRGGGLCVAKTSTVSVKDGAFTSNRANTYGGGLLALGANSKGPRVEVDLRGVHFEKNTAKDGAGANVNWYADVRFQDCLFLGNRATGWGGGVCAVGQPGFKTRLSLVDTKMKGNVARRGHGEDVRVAGNVFFDRKQLRSAGVHARRASIAGNVFPEGAQPAKPHGATPAVAHSKSVPTRRPAPGHRQPAAHVPAAPNTAGLLSQPKDAFGRALAHYVDAAVRKDYHSLRGKPGRGTARLRCYEAKIPFPDAVSVRIWEGARRHYASITLQNTGDPERAEELFNSMEERLRTHLASSQWKEVKREGHRGSKRVTFTHPRPAVSIRLTLSQIKVRNETRSTVMLFFN